MPAVRNLTTTARLDSYFADAAERDIAEARHLGICMVRDCENRPEIRGHCMRCYQRVRRGTRQSLDAVAFGRELAKISLCLSHGCNRPVEVASKGVCNAHYHRLRVHGSYSVAVKPPAAEKRCGACGEVKPRDQFNKSGKSKHGLQAYCRPCSGAINAENNRKHWSRRKYGITNDEYAAMVEAQSGRCLICDLDAAANKGGKLYIDHCHDSGKVRGLLCHNCNIGIGWMQDQPERLEAAAAYLRERG